MKDVLIVMTILGCGDNSTDCEMVHKVDAGFPSLAACQAASPAVLERLTDLAYPVIVAQCQRVQPAVAQQTADRPKS